MKRTENLRLSFFDGNGALLLEKDLYTVPLCEEAILRLSVEFFQDPEPCFLHRSAVMSRMYLELLDYFLNSGCRKHALDSLPERLAGMLHVPCCASIQIATTQGG